MQILRDTADLARLRGPVFLAVGVFDGVHLGHRALLGQALGDAAAAGGTAVAMTFEPSPARVLAPHNAPRRLASPAHKLRLLEEAGAENVLVVPFTPAYAATSATAFVRQLQTACRPLGGICVGWNWRFGQRREGDVSLLQTLGQSGGFKVDAIPAVRGSDEVEISSTLVRSLLLEGALDRVAACLGRRWSVLGPVVEGKRLGRQLGFPTANLELHDLVVPPVGVYSVRVRLEGGLTVRGIANAGVRPTVAGGADPVLEVHLLEWSGDLYGQTIEVEPVAFVRPERRFAGVEELRRQIAADIEAVRALPAA